MKTRVLFSFVVAALLAQPAVGSHHYTEKQLDALESRVGKIYWLSATQDRPPAFLVAPAAAAPSLAAGVHESFEITDLVGRPAKNPFYKVKFESGKEGYIHAQAFHEGLNSTIVASDPLADERKARAKRDEEENARIAWIHNQPWSAPVKEAAIKRQPVLGMTAGEIKKVLGEPRRVNRIRSLQHNHEEHWFYIDGKVVIFRNGVLDRIGTTNKP